MKRNKNTLGIICSLLIMVFPAASIPTYAAAASDFVYKEAFDSTPTNGVPDGVISTGEKIRVVERENHGKVLQISKGAVTAVTFPAATDVEKYVIDFSVAAESVANASISVTCGSSVCELLKIEDNQVKTSEGKTIGGVLSNASFEQNMFCGNMTDISISVNRKTGTFSAYVDEKKCLSDWKMKSSASIDGFKITKEADDENNLYLDNIALYAGEEPSNEIQYASLYNSDGEEFFSFTDDLGDFTFFNSNWPGQGSYANNIKFYPKTNSIECEKYDYKNPNKGDRIIFQKSTSDDAYIDIYCNIFKGYMSQKQYKYFKISGEFMMDCSGDATAQLFMLRDSTSSAAQINEYPIKVESSRKLTVNGTQGFPGAAQNGTCFSVTMYLDLENATMTVLLGTGYDWKYNSIKMVAREVSLTNKIKNLNLVRIACGSGGFSGELQCKNVEVTGFDKPFLIGEDTVEEVNTSMFDFDKNIADDLAGKICFNYRVGSVFANGEKYKLSDAAEYKDGDWYISEADFNKAYGAAVAAPQDGGGLVPVKETAQNVLGYNVFDDGEGLIVTSESKIYFDKSKEVPYHLRYTPDDPFDAHYRYIDRMTDLQSLYDYMLFDRPSDEQLLAGYREATSGTDGHTPTVLADKADFDRIRELAKTDPYMKRLVDDLIAQADVTLKQSLITYKYDDNLRTLNTARQLESRMQLVGFAYQMTGDKKYAQYALDNLNQLSDFPDLNPVHIIDSGSYGTGIAIAYDWCYDAFTEEERQSIRDNVYRLYLSVFPQSFFGRIPAKSVTSNDLTILMPGLCNKWFSNFNTWVNSGAICMAAAFMDDYPEICSEFMENTIRSLEYTMKNLYPEGAWVESSNYWYHVARSLMYACGTLDNIYGTDFNILSFPGAEETAVNNMAIRSMVGNYNYHDAGEEKIYASHPMGYFGMRFGQRGLLAARRATIEKSFDERMGDVDIFVADAVYYNPDVDVNEVELLPRVKTTAGMELFSVHGDYRDYDSLFFASQGGPVSFYHSHNDNGDFVFDLNGQRWASALGAEDYNSTLAESAKYRKRTEGHNTVVINNSEDYNQLASTYTSVVKSEEGEGGAYVVYDMAPNYKDADVYNRGFYIGDNFTTLTVRDEIKLSKDNSEIYWFMHTTAEAYIADDRTVLLSKDGESLVLNFETDADTAEVSIMDAAPLPSSPQGEGQTQNTGVRKIAIRLVASDSVNLTVRLGEFGESVMNTPISEWSAPPARETDSDDSDYGYTGYVYGLAMDGMGYVPVVSARSLPGFQIVPHDPSKTAEVKVSDRLDVPNIIQIYNSDRTRSKVYIVPYDTMRGIKELVYDELELAGFSVSAEPQAENPGVNMFDNDFSTRWTTLSKGEYAIFDLGEAKDVDAVAAGFWQSPVRNYYFDLYYSDDGANWTKIDTYTSSAGPEEYQVFAFDRLHTRYIKLVGNGNSANVNTNILEFRLLKRNATFEHAVPDIQKSVFEISVN